jgi:CheY-like chemotaxis protein
MTASTSPADVLVIDDDEGVRDCLTRLLEREGHAVATAADGRQALEYLHGHRPPRLILLDLAMPVMDGWEFLIQRRQYAHLRNLPVVAFSAVIDAERPDPRALGAAEVLRKPFDLAALLEETRRHCAAGTSAA